MFGRAFYGARYYGPRYFGDGGSGAPVVTGTPERKRRSTARKRKPGIVYLDGTPPLARPEVVPLIAKVKIEAREGGADRASVRGESRFLPAVAQLAAREAEDAAQITVTVTVTGLGYDEDDLEIIAIAMGGY